MGGVNRRQAIAGLGGVSLSALLAACSDDDSSGSDGGGGGERTTASEFDGAARCTQTAEQTEGPFYFDVDKVRSDIREDREGVPLELGVRVRQAGGCEPIKDAAVDIWHCDAEGSDSEPGETYLRGIQVTSRDGFNSSDSLYQKDLELTLSRRGEGYRGLMTVDVARA